MISLSSHVIESSCVILALAISFIKHDVLVVSCSWEKKVVFRNALPKKVRMKLGGSVEVEILTCHKRWSSTDGYLLNKSFA